MATDLNAKSAQQTRDDALRQPHADHDSNLTPDGAIEAPVTHPAGLMAQAVADGRFIGPGIVSRKANVLQSLQRTHGNAYVQRLVDRGGVATPTRAPQRPLQRPMPPPSVQLLPEGEMEPETAPMLGESGAGWATPPAAPPSPPDAPPAPPAAQDSAGAPAMPPPNPGSSATPRPPSSNTAPPPGAPAASAIASASGAAQGDSGAADETLEGPVQVHRLVTPSAQ
ncbi:MAG TPA: hypothetical protein VG845_13180, partial [Dehalococcoidia bacterium]|nr:hypothetical protein [Dehalococcoidia bacterium]